MFWKIHSSFRHWKNGRASVILQLRVKDTWFKKKKNLIDTIAQ